ncbi:MAG: 16S rRNA (cytidine(1402)-2'-O)-methyltransferase [Termitinemataceae bacterium]|nr:MAG: 16S rRNA (cytidine(1402)-2'-O)-methyltransferase [Termitinemataceae bacterium]
MATLYMVATPIGNLSDITLRALEVLKTVGMVACEDTRRTLPLLTHYGIQVKLISCRAANESFAAQKIVAALNGGMDVAFASDAGTPGISDPGGVLAQIAADSGHKVVPIPGASAFASLVSAAGSGGKTIIFEGFLSPKSGRRKTRLKELLESCCAFVLYESPFRVLKLFEDLNELETARLVCVGREMTKVHEEFLRGTAAEVLHILKERKEQLGEFAIFVSGRKV